MSFITGNTPDDDDVSLDSLVGLELVGLVDELLVRLVEELLVTLVDELLVRLVDELLVRLVELLDELLDRLDSLEILVELLSSSGAGVLASTSPCSIPVGIPSIADTTRLVLTVEVNCPDIKNCARVLLVACHGVFVPSQDIPTGPWKSNEKVLRLSLSVLENSPDVRYNLTGDVPHQGVLVPSFDTSVGAVLLEPIDWLVLSVVVNWPDVRYNLLATGPVHGVSALSQDMP